VPDATRGERIVAAMQQATAAPGGRAGGHTMWPDAS
jgi:hypothetical protein